MAAAERALHETAQSGVLRRLTVEDRVGVQPVERLPFVVGFARPEDPAERPLPEDLAAGGVAGRDPDPQAAVPGDRRFGPEAAKAGYGSATTSGSERSSSSAASTAITTPA